MGLNMPKGRLLFLNGASSSGKSSIAKALQEMIEEPCIHLCIDDYLGAFQKGLWDKQEIGQPAWPSIIAGFHAAAAAIAREGNLVIVDDVLEEDPPWVENLLALFDGLEVVFIGVHCPLEELERRESGRGDRKAGMARLQFEQVHARAIYDIEVDTSVQSPEACAATIADYLSSGQRPTAFEQLRALTAE
jgi:chloramphenicol 3-O phosphotransferase